MQYTTSIKSISKATLIPGLLFLFALLYFPFGNGSKDKTFNILDFGAIPDGKTLNTKAIQAAIKKAIAAKGTVVVPAGKFYTGSLLLGPNMTLKLEKDAELIASTQMGDYQQDEFILAPYADNLSITGEGTINGNGTSFFDEEWDFEQRPEPWIVIRDAKNVVVENITLINSPSHCLGFDYCNDVAVSGLVIKNDPRSPNTDGIDIRNSQGVVIKDCDIRTGDDAICIKNQRKPESLINDRGEARNKVTRDIEVYDCYLESDDAALKLGTGSGHLITDVSFRNISICDSRYGIALFMMDGGSYKNISCTDITIVTGGRHKNEYAIFMDIHQRDAASKVGAISQISFDHMDITTNGLLYFSGHPQQDIDEVSMTNSTIRVPFADNTIEKNWTKPKGNKKVKDWPTTASFVQAPATVIIAKATDFKIKNVRIHHEEGKMDRHGIYLKDIKGLDTLHIQGNTINKEALVFRAE
ncbi:MAG: glycosyl hydrolase family 28 protein [Saonia sp.]